MTIGPGLVEGYTVAVASIPTKQSWLQVMLTRHLGRAQPVKTTALVLFILLCVLAISSDAGAKQNSETHRSSPATDTASDTIKSVGEFCSKDDFKSALSAINAALAKSPADSRYLRERCKVYYLLRDPAKALSDISKAISLQPDEARNYNIRAKVYFSFYHDIKKSLFDTNRSLSLDHGNADTFVLLGQIQGSCGQYEKAIDSYNHAIALKPSSDAYRLRGIEKARAQDRAGSLSDLNKAIELNPKSAIAYSNRACTLLSMGEFARAKEDSDQATKYDAKLAAAYCNRACANLNLKRYEAAIGDCDKALLLDPNMEMAYYNRGIASAKAGDCNQATADLAEYQDSGANYKRHGSKVLLGFTFERNVQKSTKAVPQAQPIDWTKNIDISSQILAGSPDDVSALYNRALAYMCSHRYADAAHDFEHVLAKADASSRTALSSALLCNLALLHLNQPTAAREIANESLQHSRFTQWPGVLLFYFAGRASEADVFAQCRGCDKTTLAYYHLGTHKFLTGSKQAGLSMLRWVENQGDKRMDEYALAVAELNRH